MPVPNIAFNRTIVLDQNAFNDASRDLRELSSNMQKLSERIMEMLLMLEKGFRTPAGAKFISSCKNNLLEPLGDQVAVLKHIASNLDKANDNYQEVFREYERLTNVINTI